MHQYPSDISREEYAIIRKDLEGARKNTRQENMICMMCSVRCYT